MSRSPKTISQKQLAANRANAASSTGPRTAEGKVRSAGNSRKHGFAGIEFSIVRFEDPQAVANLRADLLAVYQPANSQELFAIERIALAQQALLRCSRLEAGLFTSCLNEALNPWGDPVRPIDDILTRGDLGATPAQNRNYAVAEGFRLSIKEEDTWKLFLRYQAQTERQYRRAIEEFERLKALRGELPNEPIFDPQPEAKEPTSPDSERTHSEAKSDPHRLPAEPLDQPEPVDAPPDAPAAVPQIGFVSSPPSPEPISQRAVQPEQSKHPGPAVSRSPRPEIGFVSSRLIPSQFPNTRATPACIFAGWTGNVTDPADATTTVAMTQPQAVTGVQ